MLRAKFIKIKSGIKHLGIYAFLLLKIEEQYYSYKFKKTGIQYLENPYGHFSANKQSVNQDCKKNQSSSYYVMKLAFKAVGKRYSEMSLLDIGCGDGKVLNFAMLFKFKRVIGIDLDNSAIQQAIANCNQMNKMGYKVPFNIYYADASKYIIPAGTNVIFMFNPFGRKTMEIVLNNIIQYYNVDKIELHIIYIVPVHQDLFNDHEQCCKVYELLNPRKTAAEIAVFKIIHP